MLKGNLAPDGAIIKPSAASPDLMVHRGRAVVFESIEEYHSRIDDPELDIDETCIMVLKYCGPRDTLVWQRLETWVYLQKY